MSENFGLTVFLNGVDVTGWIKSAEWMQPPRTIYRTFALEFLGYHTIPRGSSWDIYSSYDPRGVGAAELEIRKGVVPPEDEPRATQIGRDTFPVVAVRGYDWIWLAQKFTYTTTLVLAADRTKARAALRDYTAANVQHGQAPIAYSVHHTARPSAPGNFTYITVTTMHDAVTTLCHLCGFHVKIRMPNYAFNALVIDPTRSLWDAMWSLVEPFQPEALYEPTLNTLILTSALSQRFRAQTVMNLSHEMVKGAELYTTHITPAARVLIKVPRCL